MTSVRQDPPPTPPPASASAADRPARADSSYEPPRIEKVYAAADLERESLYGGGATFSGPF